MTRTEFRACDIENDVLRSKINEARREARRLKKMLAGPGYVSKSMLAVYHESLDRIIEQ